MAIVCSRTAQRMAKRTKASAPKRKLWSAESMLEAVKYVEAGGGLREASRTYNVPIETLRRRVAGKVTLDCRPGPDTILTHEEEDVLAHYVLKMADMGYGLGREDVMRVAFQIVQKSGRKHPFKEGKAGRCWMDGFMGRHPKLTLRAPQPLSFARATAASDEAMKSFFEKLGGVLSKLNLLAKPMQIYNVDETGVNIVQRPGRVITELGRKKVWAITSAERGKTHTIVSCVSASGHSLPPMMIYPRVRLPNDLKKGAVPGTLFACSENGWINCDLYLQWFKFFIESLSPARPVLLIEDGHGSHITLEVIKLAQENDIHILCLPSHTSHLLQPLDVGVFHSFKHFFNKACSDLLVSRPGSVVTTQDLASLVASAWVKALIPLNIMSGFRKCGIYPLNPGVITDRQTAPSKALCPPQESSVPLDSPPLQSSSSSKLSPAPGSGITLLSHSSSVASSGSNACSLSVSESLSDILVLPQVKESRKARRGVNQEAVCITNTSFAQALEEKECEKKRKKEEKVAKRAEREKKSKERKEKLAANKTEKAKKKMKNDSRCRKKPSKRGTASDECFAPTARLKELTIDGCSSTCTCCICGGDYNEDEDSHWICCDGCDQWMHLDCISLSPCDVPEGDFYCSGCQ